MKGGDNLTKKNIAAITGLIFIFLVIQGCDRNKSEPFPAELTGTWETQAPRYKDRTLEINASQIVFGTGQNEPNTFFIDRIKKRAQKSDIEWTFFCQDMEGNDFEIVIFHTPGTQAASITLKNKKTILWTKAED